MQIAPVDTIEKLVRSKLIRLSSVNQNAVHVHLRGEYVFYFVLASSFIPLNRNLRRLRNINEYSIIVTIVVVVTV